MPRPDAVDYAIHPIRTTIDEPLLEPRFPSAGGSIDVPVIASSERLPMRHEKLRGLSACVMPVELRPQPTQAKPVFLALAYHQTRPGSELDPETKTPVQHSLVKMARNPDKTMAR